ncbi:unnamed protein product, partial [Aureobasidium pullulans]
RFMLLAECVILWCIVAWLLRVTITRRHAVDAWKLQHCPGFKGTDNAKHPAAGTNQHAAALVVDISVVNFRLDPRLSEKDALGFIDLCNAGLGSERLGIGSSSRVSRQEKKHGRLHGWGNGVAGGDQSQDSGRMCRKD